METDINKTYQTLLILWVALLMSIVSLLIVCLVVAPPTPANPLESQRVFTFAFATVATFLVILSFLVKRKIFERAINDQDVSLVQKGLIVACAMCEGAAVLAVVERFVIGNRDAFVLFVLAAGGTALHFPRRTTLEAATYKQKGLQ
jgi:hypothetical protein